MTPRRWVHQANPKLSDLITEKTGNELWLTDLSLISKIAKYADDPKFQKTWMDIKYNNKVTSHFKVNIFIHSFISKVRLAELIKSVCDIEVSPDALFDVQCKRIHEYKRQSMNVLSVIHRFNHLKSLSPEELQNQVPRVVIFSGKAAPGYYIAKMIIKLINNVAQVLNNDPQTSDYLKCVFIPNYNVSVAEVIIPASDISQHISTAGTEASGTSNMVSSYHYFYLIKIFILFLQFPHQTTTTHEF